MKKMKNVLFGLGSIAAVVAPVAAVVACDSEKEVELITVKSDTQFATHALFVAEAVKQLDAVNKDFAAKVTEAQKTPLTIKDATTNQDRPETSAEVEKRVLGEEVNVVFKSKVSSFASKDGSAYTKLTAADIKDAAAFTAWLTKTNTALNAFWKVHEDFDKLSTADEKAKLVKDQVAATDATFKDTFKFDIKDDSNLDQAAKDKYNNDLATAATTKMAAFATTAKFALDTFKTLDANFK